MGVYENKEAQISKSDSLEVRAYRGRLYVKLHPWIVPDVSGQASLKSVMGQHRESLTIEEATAKAVPVGPGVEGRYSLRD